MTTQSHIHEQNKEVYCDVVCHDAHHGVGNSIEGIGLSCSFSFQLRKNVSKECRTEYLTLLYDGMTKRVEDTYSDLAD